MAMLNTLFYPLEPVVLWTDSFIFLLVFLILGLLIYIWRDPEAGMPWRRLSKKPLAMVCGVILMAYAGVGILDSLHYKPANSNDVVSVLDRLVRPLGQVDEITYTAPFAMPLYPGNVQSVMGVLALALGKAICLLGGVLFVGAVLYYLFIRLKQSQASTPLASLASLASVISKHRGWFSAFLTALGVVFCTWVCLNLSAHYHILGTDKVGQDVFYQSLKSIRTGLVIGLMTSLVVAPFAIGFGISAGYFGGVVDDLIQYLYTTLSSVPAVLLISAAVLSMQVFVAKHADYFSTIMQRADVRLLALCFILGVTGWTPLCRLLRGEAMKLRRIDFVVAATAMGAGHGRIFFKHILPNVLHLVIITLVLDFSGLVLAEAVLSYVGVGVDPTTISWGNMINSARLELAREPVVWWPLCSAFLFMFILVLAANLFADAVRESFETRG